MNRRYPRKRGSVQKTRWDWDFFYAELHRRKTGFKPPKNEAELADRIRGKRAAG